MFFQELDASNKDPVPVIVVGNKVDLAGKRAVSYQEGQRVCTAKLLLIIDTGRL